MEKTKLPVSDMLFTGLDPASMSQLSKSLGKERGPKATHKYIRREKGKDGKWIYIYKVMATGKEVKSEESPAYWKAGGPEQFRKVFQEKEEAQKEIEGRSDKNQHENLTPGHLRKIKDAGYKLKDKPNAVNGQGELDPVAGDEDLERQSKKISPQFHKVIKDTGKIINPPKKGKTVIRRTE